MLWWLLVRLFLRKEAWMRTFLPVSLICVLALVGCGSPERASTNSPISLSATAESTPIVNPTATVLPTNISPSPGPTAAPTPSLIVQTVGHVVEALDGETIRVAVNGQIYNVRLLGIDTPAAQHPERGPECFGPEALDAIRQLVEGKTVELEKDVNETDQDGQLLRYVYVIDSQGQKIHVNWELIRNGYANTSAIAPDTKHQEEFLGGEQEARKSQRGLWAPSSCGGLRLGLRPTSIPRQDPPAPPIVNIGPSCQGGCTDEEFEAYIVDKYGVIGGHEMDLERVGLQYLADSNQYMIVFVLTKRGGDYLQHNLSKPDLQAWGQAL